MSVRNADARAPGQAHADLVLSDPRGGAIELKYPIHLPPLVEAARRAAPQAGFALGPTPGHTGWASLTELGPVLRSLAAMHPGGRIAEIGTGTGVGTGWLADGLQRGATLLTVEIDPQRAEAATKVFAERDDVTVKCGDWKEAFADEEPFDLLFVDGGGPDMLEPEHRHEVIDLVRIGGTFIIDDITAQEFWDASWNDRSDPKRELAFNDDRVIGSEFRVTASQGALLCVRVA